MVALRSNDTFIGNTGLYINSLHQQHHAQLSKLLETVPSSYT